jgi:hypothetical protein
MRKKAPRTKGLRDLQNLPDDRWVSDAFTAERRDILDRDRPHGFYKIDKVIADMSRRREILIERTEADNITTARGMIDIAGAAAIRQARTELSAPARHKDVARLHDQLSEIRDIGRRVARANPSELAAFIARDDDVDYPDDDIRRAKKSLQHAEAVMEGLLDHIKNVTSEIDRYLERYKINHRASAAEPLTTWYMSSFAGFWHGFTGSWLKKSDSQDFRRCLVAGWIDLKFPEPTDRHGAIKPVEDHIRERLAQSDILDRYGDGN